jgi:hypothetical protein
LAYLILNIFLRNFFNYICAATAFFVALVGGHVRLQVCCSNRLVGYGFTFAAQTIGIASAALLLLTRSTSTLGIPAWTVALLLSTLGISTRTVALLLSTLGISTRTVALLLSTRTTISAAIVAATVAATVIITSVTARIGRLFFLQVNAAQYFEATKIGCAGTNQIPFVGISNLFALTFCRRRSRRWRRNHIFGERRLFSGRSLYHRRITSGQ